MATDNKVRTDKIQTDMRRMQFLVERATHQLEWANESNAPDSTPYFSFKTAQKVEDLKGAGLGLRDALRTDIAQGKAYLRTLEREAAQIRRTEHAAGVERQHHALIQADAAGDRKAKSILDGAAKSRGFLNDGELAEVKTELLKSLKAHTNFLKRNPSRRNLREILDRMAVVSSVGMDDAVTSTEALKAVTDATKSLVETAKNKFLKNPNLLSASALLADIANNDLVGGENTGHYIEKHILPRLIEMSLAAERKFRQSPSKANCEAMFNAEYACVNAGGPNINDPPKGLRRIKKGDTRFFARGATLSGVSKEYYGSFGYWDVIVRANWSIFRDPDVPNYNVTIAIPH